MFLLWASSTTLQNKALDFMFHVKHSVVENNFYFLQNIHNHIKKYNVASELITISGIGDDVIMPSYDIQNNLRILDEIINNSILHGRAKNINIDVSVVSSIDKNEILSIVNQMDDLNEKRHQQELAAFSPSYRAGMISIQYPSGSLIK